MIRAFSSRRSRGMTLVELLIACGIFLTGMVGIFALLFAGLRSHQRAIKETEATQVASSVLAEIRSDFAHGAIPKGDTRGVFKESRDFPGYSYSRSIVSLEPARTGVPADLADREFFVRVRVRWSERGENQFVEINTIIFRSPEFK